MAYSEEDKQKLFNEICRLISIDGFSLRKALLNQSLTSDTFYNWIDSDKTFKLSLQYARACDDRTEMLADEILEIADEQNADTHQDDDGNTVTDGSAIARSRLKVDTRKWLMSKMNAKKYGDNNTLKLEGGEKPINISFED